MYNIYSKKAGQFPPANKEPGGMLTLHSPLTAQKQSFHFANCGHSYKAGCNRNTKRSAPTPRLGLPYQWGIGPLYGDHLTRAPDNAHK